jgi:hypothetical protein
MLSSLSGLENLNTVGGHLVIGRSYSGNPSLNSIVSLENLSTVGGDLAIANTDKLTSLTGLDNLSTTGGLYIYDNELLADLTGLGGLSTVEGDVSIGSNNHGGNPFLKSLAGLNNLYSIEGKLSIMNNVELTSLSGLDNIDGGSIEHLYIYGNDLLSDCAVLSVCNYIASPNGILEIYDNASGCDSVKEVEIACEGLRISDDPEVIDVLLYPNPSSGAVHLRFSNTEHRTLNTELYSIQGIKVRTLLSKIQPAGEYELSFDIGDLPDGMYFVRMQIGRQVETMKLILIK